MTEVQKQIEELTTQVVQAAKDGDVMLVTQLGNQINDLREIQELEKELVVVANDGDTVSAVSISNKINELKGKVTA